MYIILITSATDNPEPLDSIGPFESIRDANHFVETFLSQDNHKYNDRYFQLHVVPIHEQNGTVRTTDMSFSHQDIKTGMNVVFRFVDTDNTRHTYYGTIETIGMRDERFYFEMAEEYPRLKIYFDHIIWLTILS